MITQVFQGCTLSFHTAQTDFKYKSFNLQAKSTEIFIPEIHQYVLEVNLIKS